MSILVSGRRGLGFTFRVWLAPIRPQSDPSIDPSAPNAGAAFFWPSKKHDPAQAGYNRLAARAWSPRPLKSAGRRQVYPGCVKDFLYLGMPRSKKRPPTQAAFC